MQRSMSYLERHGNSRGGMSSGQSLNELPGSSCPDATRGILNGSRLSSGYTRRSLGVRICVGGSELSAPDAWINTDDPAKDTREVRLIRHPTVEGNLR